MPGGRQYPAPGRQHPQLHRHVGCEFPNLFLNSQITLQRRGLSLLEEEDGLRNSNLPTEGFVRLWDIIAPRGPIPISRSSWWAGVKDGRFPKPVKIGGLRIAVWRVEDIRILVQRS